MKMVSSNEMVAAVELWPSNPSSSPTSINVFHVIFNPYIGLATKQTVRDVSKSAEEIDCKKHLADLFIVINFAYNTFVTMNKTKQVLVKKTAALKIVI